MRQLQEISAEQTRVSWGQTALRNNVTDAVSQIQSTQLWWTQRLDSMSELVVNHQTVFDVPMWAAEGTVSPAGNLPDANLNHGPVLADPLYCPGFAHGGYPPQINPWQDIDGPSNCHPQSQKMNDDNRDGRPES